MSVLCHQRDRLGLMGVSTHTFRRTALTQMSSLEVSALQLDGAIAALISKFRSFSAVK
ncbi:hypothetical protein NDA01_23255 [Trichocoleus desertorum AS-A10]|uniref:hypothetical protein n=1 Tax=Trichocoleus desertorum TaxID=1481672 RepID=UPI003299A578